MLNVGSKFTMEVEFEVIASSETNIVFQMRGDLAKSYLKYYNIMRIEEFNDKLENKIIKMKDD